MFAIVLTSALVVTGWYGSATARSEINELSERIIQDHLRGLENYTHQMVDDTEATSKSVSEIAEIGLYKNNLDAEVSEIQNNLDLLKILIKDNPEVFFLSFTVEKSGAFYMVSMDPKREKILYQINLPLSGGMYHRQDWEVTDFGKKQIINDKKFKVDSRKRPYYLLAKSARHKAWTPSYEFLVSGSQKPVVGITCATPLYSPGGQLLGVATADLVLEGLGQFLRRSSLSEDSVNLVIEQGAKEPKVIASSGSDAAIEKFYEQSALKAYLDNSAEIRGEQELNLSLDGKNGQLKMTPKYVRASTNWVIVNLTRAEYFTKNLDDAIAFITWFGFGMILLGIAVAYILSNRITRPLLTLANEADKIRLLDFTEPPALITKIAEVARLDNAVDGMRAGLRSFEKLVPAAYVRSLIADGDEATLGGERKELTILFCDIEGFTKFAEAKPLDEVIHHLNRFLEACTNELLLQGATIDKYLGDEVMAFWGAPNPVHDQEVKAARAALRIQMRLDFLHRKMLERDEIGLRARIGITSGETIVGNVGTHERMNYTAIGDKVNLASRLQGLNKHYGTRILMDQPTAKCLTGHFAVRLIDRVSVVGREASDEVFELMGLRDDEELTQICAQSELALQSYFDRNFAVAVEIFEALRDVESDSKWANIMQERCKEFIQNPPADDWGGTFSIGFK